MGREARRNQSARDVSSRQLIELIVNPDWSRPAVVTQVWVEAYRVAVDMTAHTAPALTVSWGDVTATVLRSRLNFTDASALAPQLSPQGLLAVNIRPLRPAQTPEGVYLLLATPYDNASKDRNEAAVRQAISTAVGLFGAVAGRNAVYSREFENVMTPAGQSSALSPVGENPQVFQKPDLSVGGLAAIAEVGSRINALPDAQRNRFNLSLRWFNLAMHTPPFPGSHTEILLKYWIALETLAMPDETNIRPLNESLGRVYSMAPQDANAYFAIGRLFGLRSRIVHNGEQPVFHHGLLMYLEAVYADVLFDALALPSEHRARSRRDATAHIPS